jgi:hypothetical protein
VGSGSGVKSWAGGGLGVEVDAEAVGSASSPLKMGRP